MLPPASDPLMLRHGLASLILPSERVIQNKHTLDQDRGFTYPYLEG